jgi:hypothetical protein
LSPLEKFMSCVQLWHKDSCCPQQGSDAFSQSGLYSNHQDIGPRYAVR